MIRDFNYWKASSKEEALELLAAHKEDYKIICGGQSLIILLRQGLIAPENLIDIKGAQDLSYIKFSAKSGLRLGAATTHRDIENSPQIRKHYPLLVSMEQNLASIQTRNSGTIGGNLAHGDPTGDPGPVLLALNASVKISRREGSRTLPLDDFFVDIFETALEEGELLEEIRIPVIPPRTGVAYEKFNIIKNHQGIVTVAASVTLDEKGQTCEDLRIVLGAAAPVPLRAKGAEEILRGKKLEDDILEEAAQKASEESDPVGDIHATEEYRRLLVRVLTEKMVKEAWEQARKSNRQ